MFGSNVLNLWLKDLNNGAVESETGGPEPGLEVLETLAPGGIIPRDWSKKK